VRRATLLLLALFAVAGCGPHRIPGTDLEDTGDTRAIIDVISKYNSALEARDANAILIGKPTAEQAMDSAACIGCGACVAACKNASAALFTSAKVSHLALLPQGQVERDSRAVDMVERHDAEGFGSCSNEGECEAVCPKEISIANIARMNREYFRATLLRGR